MIKIKQFDPRGVWSITTPISYASQSDIEKLPDVIIFIEKYIGAGKYDIERASPTGTNWYLIDKAKVDAPPGACI